MPDSRQLDILKRLTSHLEGITPANGYAYDMSQGNVFRGRRYFGDSDPDVVLSIVEHLQGDISVQVAGWLNELRIETWVVLIQGWMKSNGDHPTDELYQLKASVEKRLSECITTSQFTGRPVYSDAYLLGRTISNMAIGPGVVSVPVGSGDASSRAFFYLPVGLDLVYDVSDPFVGA
jgi:hypothetical protein